MFPKYSQNIGDGLNKTEQSKEGNFTRKSNTIQHPYNSPHLKTE